MKTPSLERFYIDLNKSILLAQAYSEVKELSFILKSCRMKPYDIVYKKEKPRIKLYRYWFDEFGNSITILKKKKIKLTYNDLFLRQKEIICTDLYYGLSIDKIVKISKLVHLIIGAQEDDQSLYFIISFLGLDGYLRSFMYDGEWKTVSPLMLGLKRLKNIFKYSDVKYFHELKIKENIATPCRKTDEWISSLIDSPVEFVKILQKRYDINFNFLLE